MATRRATTSAATGHRRGSGVAVDVRDAVVLCGAGISIESPSHLPSGTQLAFALLDLVAHGASDPYAADAVADVRRDITDSSLRLEVISDLMAVELPPLTVA